MCIIIIYMEIYRGSPYPRKYSKRKPIKVTNFTIYRIGKSSKNLKKKNNIIVSNLDVAYAFYWICNIHTLFPYA